MDIKLTPVTLGALSLAAACTGGGALLMTTAAPSPTVTTAAVALIGLGTWLIGLVQRGPGMEHSDGGRSSRPTKPETPSAKN